MTGGGWKGKPRQWIARKALALFKRAAMSERAAKSHLVDSGLPADYVNKLLDAASDQRRSAMDLKNQRARERRLMKKVSST